MKKFFLLLVVVLLALGLGGWVFMPGTLLKALHRQSPSADAIYQKLEDLSFDQALSELYDELQVAAEQQLNLNHRNQAGLRGIDVAATHDQAIAAAAFIVAGADINNADARGDTILHIAVRHHALHVLKEMRRFMPDLNRRNKDGLTALDLARQLNDDAAAAILSLPLSQT